MLLARSAKSPEIREQERAFGKARTALTRRGNDPEIISRIYQDYFRERFQLPPGELTTPQLLDCLQAAGVPDELVDRAGRLLESLLATRFGSAGLTIEELEKEVMDMVRDIEKIV